jgi:hypothetical protein
MTGVDLIHEKIGWTHIVTHKLKRLSQEEIIISRALIIFVLFSLFIKEFVSIGNLLALLA